MTYLGQEIVIVVYYRRFPLDNLMLVDTSDHRNGVFFCNRLGIGRVILAEAGMNDL